MNSSNDDKLTAPGSSREVMMDEEAPANGAVEQPRPQTKGSFSLWARLGAALAVVGITATSVAVPLSLRESDDNSSSMYVPPNYTTPFNETVEELPLLGDSVLNGYPTIQAFKDSLRLVAESYVNGVVARNVGDKTYENFALSPSFAVGEDVMAMDGDMMNTATPRESSQEAVNDYETNDQEEGVREGDNVVSNGVIAIAAYGDEVVGWEVAGGDILLRMVLPPTGGYSQPYINTLVLHGDYLIAAVSGYGSTAQQTTTRVLSGYQGTRILIYDISTINGGQMDLVATRDVNGDFVTIRVIESQIFFILNSQINIYNFLAQPFNKYSTEELRSLDANAYSLRIREMAETAIPDFVDQATEEILECDQIPKLVALNRWTTDEHSDPIMESYLYNSGIAQSLVMVISFDLQDVIDEKPDALQCLSVSGSFFPTNAWDVKAYSAANTMIMATRGYDYSPARQMTIDSTYLVAFDLTGEVVAPKAYGYVEGYVLDQYSFRVEGDILQLATTIQEGWIIMFAEPMGMRRLQAVIEPDIIRTEPATENYVITMDLAASQSPGQERQMFELDRLKLGKDGEVFTTVRFYPGLAYAVTYQRVDPFYVINTEDPLNVFVEGELDNITGWSSYLEPINPPE
mmetsp:Transcript_4303/g.9554  ORF Transcript_4303/g.9554 Transcript_4303/m.9554 type:complete len:631 (-) Transcript_4303:717-2609(-)